MNKSIFKDPHFWTKVITQLLTIIAGLNGIIPAKDAAYIVAGLEAVSKILATVETVNAPAPTPAATPAPVPPASPGIPQ